MESAILNPMIALVAAVAGSALLTMAVRYLAVRFGQVAKPRSDRWHKRPTAMLGGTAIFLTVVLLYFVLVPGNSRSLVILGASAFLFLVGLVDDLRSIKPYQKLIGQLIGASAVVGFGLYLPITGIELADIWITVFWLVGITNAVNLLDNMDGLAAGIAAIAAASLAIGFASFGQAEEAILVAVFIGALLGFLIFNFNPASIFMGDCGSMFVGFFLASSVLLSESGGRSRSVFTILAVPVLILFVPIFDTTFVTILRKIWGRRASQGGRDHTSHRLVALGLSERTAVLMIYGFAVVAGILALLVSRLQTTQSLALISLFTIVLAIAGVFLSNVKVYDESEEELASRNNAVFAFLVDVSYKRRIFEVLLDAMLITLAYYASYVLIFGSFESSGNWEIFLKSLPLLVVLKLFAFLATGVYRGLWRYTSVADLIVFLKGVALGSILSVLGILLLWRFEGFSRAVFFLDGSLLLLALFGSRMAFRLLREVLPVQHATASRRVLIYGAGDGGEMVLREIRNNPKLEFQPVCFVDDDLHKRDKVISGLKVYEGNGAIEQICRDKNIEEILISFKGIDAGKLADLRTICRHLNISLKKAELRIESVDFE